MRKAISIHINLTTNTKLANVIAFFFLAVGVYFSWHYVKCDNKGYEYGLGCNFCNKNLPFNLTSSIDRYGSFMLNDDEGFALIGNGFGYKESSFIIKDILAYGYNDTAIVMKCVDSLNVTKYLISYETKNKNKKGNPEISFKDLSNSDFEEIKNNYQWVELDEEKGNKIRFYRALSFVGAVLSLLLLLWHLIRKRKATQ